MSGELTRGSRPRDGRSPPPSSTGRCPGSVAYFGSTGRCPEAAAAAAAMVEAGAGGWWAAAHARAERGRLGGSVDYFGSAYLSGWHPKELADHFQLIQGRRAVEDRLSLWRGIRNRQAASVAGESAGGMAAWRDGPCAGRRCGWRVGHATWRRAERAARLGWVAPTAKARAVARAAARVPRTLIISPNMQPSDHRSAVTP